ncbi:MAG: sulfur carrier protein ThiS [Actinobacteria bacterium]|nr:sulfur carrier protein ThiS [Actinomycetota bacterium]
MTITLNGDVRSLAEETTVAALLDREGLPPAGVAVAVNGDVVTRELWERTAVGAGDEVEVIRIIQGGADDGGDALVIGGVRFTSRLFTGTGKFTSGALAGAALAASGTELVTVAIRYVDLEHPGASGVLDGVDLERYRLLPNTAGATNAEHAVKMARLARAATGTDLIKLEVIGDRQYLWPDNAETIVATKQLVGEGFVVLPYVSADLVTALRLEEAGAATVMPLASPIGSGQGYNDWVGIERIVGRVSLPVVVDAGIGVPSEAAMAMELGAAAVLVNTAIARAKDPVAMAHAMKLAVIAGRTAFLAGRMPRRGDAEPSSPQHGVPTAPTPA